MGANSRLGAYSNKYGSPTQIYLKHKKRLKLQRNPVNTVTNGPKAFWAH